MFVTHQDPEQQKKPEVNLDSALGISVEGLDVGLDLPDGPGTGAKKATKVNSS